MIFIFLYLKKIKLNMQKPIRFAFDLGGVIIERGEKGTDENYLVE